MKYKIGEKTYDSCHVMKPTVGQFLELANESGKYGKRWTQGEVYKLDEDLSACKTEAERMAHPDWMFMMPLNIWAALAVAGEPNPFAKVLTLSLIDDVEFVYDEGELEAIKAVQDDAETPTRARAGSVRAGVKRPTDRRSPRKTSKSPSTLAS